MSSQSGDAQPDHLLSNRASTRRLLDGLRVRDPLEALRELSRWYSSLATAPGLGAACHTELLFAIDDSAQQHLLSLTRAYATARRPSLDGQRYLRSTIDRYCQESANAYRRALRELAQGEGSSSPGLAVLLVRSLRCFRRRIEWIYLCYSPIDTSAWADLNRAYAFSEKLQLADVRASEGSGEAVEQSTPRQEFLAAAMLSVISLGSLLPHEIELAAQLTVEHAAYFVLSCSPGPGLPYWIDLERATPGQRVVSAPRASGGLRFFGAGGALHRLNALAKSIDSAARSPLKELTQGRQTDPETVLTLLRHLTRQWASQSPQRRHLRHEVLSRVLVAHGFLGVLAVLDERQSTAGEVESWVVENVSWGGFGVVLPQAFSGDWLYVGTLLAIQPEGGGDWVIGVVRRVSQTVRAQVQVGIETLSKTPAVAHFLRAGLDLRGIWLGGGFNLGDEAQLILPEGALESGEPAEVEVFGERCRFLPQGLAQRGADYEVASLRVQPREE